MSGHHPWPPPSRPSDAAIAITKIYGNSVWVENDMLGDAHVMLQSEAPGSEPACVATVRYSYPWVDNSTRNRVAMNIARMFGAAESVEFRLRPMPQLGGRARAIDAEAKDVAGETGAVVDWQPMLTAPRDGSEIEIMRRSPSWYYASDDQKPIWEEAVRSHWINFNGGGWVWSGIVGEALAWRPVAAPTAVEGRS